MEPVTGVTLWQRFLDILQLSPDGPALTADGETSTWRDLNELAVRASGHLADAGVVHDCHVLVRGANDLASVVVALACSRLGAVFVPVPATLGAHELKQIVDRVKPQRVVQPARGKVDVRESSLDSTSLLHGEPREEPPAQPLPADAVAVVGWTSGTTGRPKGVMQTSAAIDFAAQSWSELLNLQLGESALAVLPISYLAGYALNVHLSIARGLHLVCLDRWDPIRCLQLLEQHHCTWMMVIPTQLFMLVEAAESRLGRPPLAHMRAITCGGSPMAPEEVDRASHTLGAPVLRAYGMSECLGAAMNRLEDSYDTRLRMDGRPIRGTDVRTIDEHDRELASGETGEGVVGGPSLFRGYFEDPDGTRRALWKGRFLRTGDLLQVTGDGHVQVVGRTKDIIIRGGLNIDPLEIERLIQRHPQVSEVAVVGVPDARLGEIVCAAVVPAPGPPLEFEELIQHLRGLGLTTQKLPERLELVETLPRSSIGKIAKAQLRNRLAGRALS